MSGFSAAELDILDAISQTVQPGDEIRYQLGFGTARIGCAPRFFSAGLRLGARRFVGWPDPHIAKTQTRVKQTASARL